MTRKFGVIVGSGLDKDDCPFGTSEVRHFELPTPYGAVKFSEFPLGNDTSLLCTARHLTGHVLLPSEVNYRGIMYAMKILRVEAVIGISAVGSRRKEIEPGMLVAVNQYIDCTYGRPNTFFGDGIAGHVTFDQPVCYSVWSNLILAGLALGTPVRPGATLMVMQGPAFSTKAEAQRGMQIAELIGMTSMPEAKLAREAELRYCTLAAVTDYDCCFADRPAVTAEEVGRVFKANKERATAVVREAIRRFFSMEDSHCSCQSALDTAIMTDPEQISPYLINKLNPIINRWAKVHQKK